MELGKKYRGPNFLAFYNRETYSTVINRYKQMSNDFSVFFIFYIIF